MENNENREGPNISKAEAYFFSGCCGVFLGDILGGVGGFVLPPVYYKMTSPHILEDGQWGMVYLLTLPAGIIIGAVLGCVIACVVVAIAQRRN